MDSFAKVSSTDKGKIMYPWIPVAPRRLLVKADPRPELRKAISLTLGGKILGSTEYDEKEIRGDLIYAWKPQCMVTFLKVSKFIVSIKFFSEADKKLALGGGPWFVNKDLIILAEASEDSAISRGEYQMSKFWVRVLDIPLKGQTKDLSDTVGSMFDGVVEYDLPKINEGESEGENSFRMKQTKDYLRVKVNLNITKPLYRDLPLDIEKEDKSVVSLNVKLGYEVLPDFCYLCGIIGHGFKYCLHFEEGMTIDDMPYDDSLKATKLNIVRPWNRPSRVNKGKASSSSGPSHKVKALPAKTAQEKRSKKVDESIDLPPVRKEPSIIASASTSVAPGIHSVPMAHTGNFLPTELCAPTNPNAFQIFQTPPGVVHSYNPMHYNQRAQFGSTSSWGQPSNTTPDPNYLRFLELTKQGFFSEPDVPSKEAISAPVDMNKLKKVAAGATSYFAPLEKRRKKKKKKNSDEAVDSEAPLTQINMSDDEPKDKGSVAKRTRSSGKKFVING